MTNTQNNSCTEPTRTIENTNASLQNRNIANHIKFPTVDIEGLVFTPKELLLQQVQTQPYDYGQVQILPNDEWIYHPLVAPGITFAGSLIIVALTLYFTISSQKHIADIQLTQQALEHKNKLDINQANYRVSVCNDFVTIAQHLGHAIHALMECKIKYESNKFDPVAQQQFLTANSDFMHCHREYGRSIYQVLSFFGNIKILEEIFTLVNIIHNKYQVESGHIEQEEAIKCFPDKDKKLASELINHDFFKLTYLLNTALIEFRQLFYAHYRKELPIEMIPTPPTSESSVDD